MSANENGDTTRMIAVLLAQGKVVRDRGEVEALERRARAVEDENRLLRAKLDKYERLPADILRLLSDRLGGGSPVAADVELRSAHMERRYMKIKEYAERGGFGERTVQGWIGEGLPVAGEGRARRVLVAEADAWLRSRSSRRAG